MLEELDKAIAAGRLGEARGKLLAILKSSPDDAAAYRRLADVELRLKRPDRAALALEQLTAHSPGIADAWRWLAEIYVDLAQPDKAVRAYEQAARLGLDGRDERLGLASALFAAQRFKELGRLLDELRTRFPDTAATSLLEGHVARMSGRTLDAQAAYRRALSQDPGHSAATFNLVELETPAADSAFASELVARSSQDATGGRAAADVNFSLGRIYENAQRHAEAFERYVCANRQMQHAMRSRGITYDPAAVEARIRHTIDSYPKSAFVHASADSQIDLTPIFIVGMPRSGTTLVEQILASHPDVSAGGELVCALDCHEAHAALRRRLGLDASIDWGNPGEARRLRELRQRYVDCLLARGLDGAYVTNKLPGDFEILGFIRMLLPKAVIVHCRREPMATCWSLFTANFGMHSPYYNDLEHLAHYYGQYRELMAHWRAVLQPALIEVDYERLIADPEPTIRALVKGCGLDWDDRCLRPHETDRPVATASSAQVRRPINPASLAKWRPYAKQLERLRERLDNG